ncbi:MAG: ribokinase [Brachybacterium sp.]|uniref:ribokinase n=1 Tax=Brachybacterium sp. TaxID=1891286 RepID=UPI002647F6A7|nr:ribokinase [Brachybacterium sp.]MDN5685386.1 ribokinase [Brachybacterium sp.]
MTAPNSTGAGAGAGRILVVGSVNVDLALSVARHPEPGETLLGSGSRRSPGGKGANQACAASRLGGDVRFAARTGTGPDADLALSLLQDAGTDLSTTTEVPDVETGLAVVTVDEAGENSIVILAGANGTWSPEHVDALHVEVATSEIVVSQGEIPAPAIDQLARLSAETGTRFLLNLAPVIDVAEHTLTTADPLVVNESEGRLVLEAMTGATAAIDDTMTVHALRSAGIPSVVMTRGAHGVIVSHENATAEITSPTVTAVDSTGAGDAFVGALAVELAQGHGLDEACRHAARVGAFAVTRPGAQPSYPDRQDDLPALDHA